MLMFTTKFDLSESTKEHLGWHKMCLLQGSGSIKDDAYTLRIGYIFDITSDCFTKEVKIND